MSKNFYKTLKIFSMAFDMFYRGCMGVRSLTSDIYASLSFERSSHHCLAALDLGTGAEQPVDSLIVQNRQVLQSMRRSIDWTLEDNMVDSLFFCATITVRRGDHSPFVPAGAETPDIRRRLSRTQALLGRVISTGVGDENVGLSNHSAFHW